MNSLSLKRLQNGVAFERDEQAYRQLFLHYYPPLSRFALGFVKTKEASEEVVSDVMMKLWSLQGKLGEVVNLTVYLYRATRNQCLNYLRSSHKMTLLSIEMMDGQFGYEADTPEQHVMRNEWKEQLRLAVQQLPPKCGMVYKLIREDGFSYKQAAAVMDITENTVDRHLNKALHKLVRSLRPYAVGTA